MQTQLSINSTPHRYFPAKVNATIPFESIAVTLRKSERKDGYVENTLTLSRGGQHRTVTQFWYTSWPDHGVPTDDQDQMFVGLPPFVNSDVVVNTVFFASSCYCIARMEHAPSASTSDACHSSRCVSAHIRLLLRLHICAQC
jgi:hypothetical protein